MSKEHTPFACNGVTFVSVWVPGEDHHNGGHYERRSVCGRIVCRRTEGELWHEVAVDGRRHQARLASMKAAMLSGVARLTQLQRMAS